MERRARPAAIRALVVEDDPAWQEILAEILVDAGLAVDVADSLQTAVAELRRAPHRLAVVDLSLGGADHHNQEGLAVLDAVRRHDPGCLALLLTGYATVELAVSALTAHGAYTCLRKEVFRRAEFHDLVRRALAAPSPAASPELHRLTARERQVLALLARGMTNKDIAQRLVITPNTVKRHLKAVFEKLGVHTRAAAAAKAVGVEGGGLGRERPAR